MFSFSLTCLFFVLFATLVNGDGMDIWWPDGPLLTNTNVLITWTRDNRRDTTTFDVITDPLIPGQQTLSVDVAQDEFNGDVGNIVFQTPGSYQLLATLPGDPSSILLSYGIDIKLNRRPTAPTPITPSSSSSFSSSTTTMTVTTVATTSPGNTSPVGSTDRVSETSSSPATTSSHSHLSPSSTAAVGTAIPGVIISSGTSSATLTKDTQDSGQGSASSQVIGNTANATPNSIKIILPTVLVIVFIVLLLIFWRLRRRRRLLKPEPFQPPSEDRLVQDGTESHPDMTEHINSSPTNSIIINPPYRVLSSSNSGQVISDVKSTPSLETDSLMALTSTEGTVLKNDSEAMQARIAALEQAQHDAEMQISRLRAENEVWRRNRDSDEVSLATSPPSYTPP
ncbi:hypothetical protein C8J56DRAFT_952483 [Mycena floridula]|nr:hypothetical protein C8J56DRAFT_952483 [Mycena floridula]